MRDLENDPARDGVAGLREQRDEIRREWLGKLQPTLSQIDQVWENYERTQNDVATNDQRRGREPVTIERIATEPVDTYTLNQWVPYFDMTIGLCLLLGLFTPLAALAAAGFLGSVFLSQFPPVAGPTSSYYQLIEGTACLVLAATASGRFAGLDYFLHLIIRRVYGTQQN